MEGSRFDKRTAEHRRRFRVRAALALLAFAGVAFGSIPSATVPPSAYENGLTTVPNPIDRSANLPITGNVAGGRHFRGPIPYDSPTSFGAPLGSTTLDSFRRYSTVPQDQNGYPYNYNPYYSPSGSVSTMLPGQQGVFAPGSPRIAGGLPQVRSNAMADMMPMVEAPKPQTPMSERADVIDSGLRAGPQLPYAPMSPSLQEMGDILSNEPGASLPMRPTLQPPDPTMTPEEYRRQVEQLRRDLERVQANAARLGQNLNVESVPPQLPWQQPLPQPPVIRPGETPADSPQMVPPVEVRPEFPNLSPGAAQPDTTETGKLPALQRIEETARAFDTASKLLQRPGGEPVEDVAGRAARPWGAAETAEDVPDVADPNRVRPTTEGSGSSAPAQFDHYLATGASYLRQGKYYRAAESFTLASIYLPHDPRAHLGKSHALLAAGDYVSSAVSLARTVELDAHYALRKVNLVETIGGPEAFVQRITNLEEAAKAGAAPQLQFLLAYIYFQTDQPNEAKLAIEAARKGLSSSAAVSLLEAAIQGNPGSAGVTSSDEQDR